MDPFAQVNFVPFRSAVRPPSLFRPIGGLLQQRKAPERKEGDPDPAQYSLCDPVAEAGEYRRLLEGMATIAVFRNGTCVFAKGAATREQVIELMKVEGPLEVGSSKADFFVGKIRGPLAGTIVRYHHPNIVSFVNEREYALDCPDHVVGALVRTARHCDAKDLHIVHFESA